MLILAQLRLSLREAFMKLGLRSLVLVLTFAEALSACQVPADRAAVSGSSLPMAWAGGDFVRTSPVCREDEGGRHFGDTTAFSEDPFNGCWPQ
jgi:hypothetical protein